MTNDVIHDNILQWKYTHCRYNQNNSSGFYTYAMSEGLSKEDEADLKSFAGSYEIPTHMPSEVKSEPPGEILHLFPVVFSSFRLRSGKRAITRVRYVGKNYDDRKGGGNYFVHGLVLPEGYWRFYPIDLCWDNQLMLPIDNPRSRIWFDGLKFKDEQEIGRVPPPLPTVEIREEHLKRFSFYDFDKLFDIKKQFGPTDRFEQFRLLFTAMQDSRKIPVLLRDKPENIAVWIAAIQYALPVFMSQDVTFTTYCNSDEKARKFNIVGTSFDGNVLKIDSLKYAGFDFEAGMIPTRSTKGRYPDYLAAEDFPGTSIDECRKFADNNGVVISPFGNTPDDLILLNDFIRGQIDSGNSSDFSAAWNVYKGLPPGGQRYLLRDFFRYNMNKPMSMSYLPIFVPHFEEMAGNTTLPGGNLQELFTQWFVDQLVANLEDKAMLDLLKRLKNKKQYAKLLSERKGTRNHDVLNTFLPLFESVSDGKRSLEPVFVQYVIRQFSGPLNTTWTDQRYAAYHDDVKTIFYDTLWKPHLSLFLRKLSDQLQEDQLLFHINLLLLVDPRHIKTVEAQLRQIASFVKDRPQATQSAFFKLVLDQVFPTVTEPQMKYLLFEYFLREESNELSAEFCKNHLLNLVDGCRVFYEIKPSQPPVQ